MSGDTKKPELPGVTPTDDLLIERLKTIGRLSDGLSGDLRQSLSVIRNSVYLLSLQLGETAEDHIRRHLSVILREIGCINRIATNLSSMSMRRDPDRQPSDLPVIVGAALEQVTVPKSITVETVVPAASRVYCDPAQISCALANLVVNAAQAMPDGGRIRIVCREESSETRIEVRDNGVGMNLETISRAFEPLYSTVGHRAGLGLSVVRALVGRNGGTVSLDSSPGEGTTVLLRFPKFA